MSKIKEIAWPQEFIEFKRIEESMVCGICYEYMETTVITPCSHNYCSLCIRKYLHYKSQCPACFQVFFEKDLYINRTMDILIQHYIKVREKLISVIENRIVYNTVVQQREESPNIQPVRPERSNHFLKSPQIQEIKQSDPKTPIFPSTSRDTCSPTTCNSSKTIPSIAKIFNTPKRKEIITDSGSAAAKSVSCPVCSVEVSENHINVHLDACLKREFGQKVAKEKQKPKRQPLPKLVLRVMKDPELRKKMKEFGLPTNGDRRALEQRFTRYSTIYNAECDKLEPRSITDLLRQCEMEEKQERKMDLFLVSSTSNSASSVRLQIEKDAKEEKIEEAQKNYRLANKSDFDKLIEEVRNRKTLAQAKQTDNVRNSNNDPISISNRKTTENDFTNTANQAFNPSAEIPFNDSDSDESCPLQHYKSDDPMQLPYSNSSPSASTFESPVKPFRTSHTNDYNKSNLTKPINTSDIYEASTDVSTDDEIRNSPITNGKLNRKKVRLSDVSSKQSTSTELQNKSEMNNSIEKNTHETLAKDLCNPIIDDFSFEGMSDDSFSEYSQKNEAKAIEKEQFNEKSSKTVDRAPSRNTESRASCDIFRSYKLSEEVIKRVILGEYSSNKTDDYHNVKRVNNNYTKLVNSHTVDAHAVDKTKIENAKSNIQLENMKTEKENNIFIIDDNFEFSTNEITIRRPVRKRNRPSRYADNQTSKPDVNESTLCVLVEESLENDSPDSLKAVITSDGSMKRRRGKSKTVNLPADELHNPPKRPLRRRQVVAVHN